MKEQKDLFHHPVERTEEFQKFPTRGKAQIGAVKKKFSTSKIPLSAYRFTEKEDARALGWGRKERKEKWKRNGGALRFYTPRWSVRHIKIST